MCNGAGFTFTPSETDPSSLRKCATLRRLALTRPLRQACAEPGAMTRTLQPTLLVEVLYEKRRHDLRIPHAV